MEVFSDAQVDSSKSMEYSEFLTLPSHSKELQGSQSVPQLWVILLLLRSSLEITFFRLSIRLSTKPLNIGIDQVINLTVEV